MLLRLFIAFSVILSLTGCAANKTNVRNMEAEIKELNAQIKDLESEIEAKDKVIDDMEKELEKKEFSRTEKDKSKKGISAQKTPKNIQRALKNSNFYNGAVDGKIGKNTKEAIKAFQKANGLRADGIVGKKTWSALSKYLD